MSAGSVLVGIALLLIVVAYLAHPFRLFRASADLDRAIEAWVAQVRMEGKERQRRIGVEEQRREETEAHIAYCPQCGRRVGPDDRFCAGCGVRLRGGAE